MNFVGYLLFGEERNEAHNRLKLYRMLLRNNADPFAFDSVYFQKFYRMPPALALELINLLSFSIEEQALCRLPVHVQVLSALRFFAEGSYQKGTSQDFNHAVSQPTFSRCLKGVIVALCQIGDQWIKFPKTREERIQVSERFQMINRIPGILGLVDCFVVKMVRPSVHEEAFFHYKHSHSMNVQVVSDMKYIIQSIRICPGSCTDRYIWKFSDVRQYMLELRENEDIVNEEGKFYILGDSGYTPSPVLLTPITNAREQSPEARYTENHVRTRCKVEQLFGILSNTWLSISRRRTLHYHPQKIAQIILACAVLHNFRKLNGLQDDLPEINNNISEAVNVHHAVEDYRLGLRERERLIQQCYTH